MKQLIKKSSALTACSLLFFLGSCQQSNRNDVSTVFLHKYGVSLAEEDWKNRGGNGQIIVTKADGSTVTKNYVEGELEGASIYTFPHSFTHYKEEVYSRGHLISELFHYTSGVPKEKLEFLSDQETLITRWYENGNPKNNERYQNGKLLTGEYFSDKNDIEATVTDGNGTKIERNAFGEFLSRMEVIYGDVVRKTLYYPNGDPKEIIPYKNNKIHGTLKKFLVNGIPDSFEEWDKGVQQGVATLFRDGVLFSTLPYVSGKKNGTEKIHRTDGQIVAEITWKNDLKHGPSVTFIENVERTEWYHKGKKVSKSDFERLAGD